MDTVDEIKSGPGRGNGRLKVNKYFSRRIRSTVPLLLISTSRTPTFFPVSPRVGL